MRYNEKIDKLNKYIINNYISHPDDYASFDGKEKIMLAQAFFNSGDAAAANRLLEEGEHWKEFHTFLPLLSIVTLLEHKTKLSAENVEKLEKYVVDCNEINLLSAWDFIAVNDNTPAMIAACLLLSGEYFSNDEWQNTAAARIAQFKKTMKRRGFSAEFNSPTYTPITVWSLAKIVQHSKNDRVADDARFCEERLWESMLALYHKEFHTLCGAFGRAYIADKTCFANNARAAFYCLDDDVFSEFPLCEESGAHAMISAAWMACCEYHCPKHLIERMKARTYPYSVCGTAEISVSADSHLINCIGKDIRAENLLRKDTLSVLEQNEIDEYACSVSDIGFYAQKSYALGTATHEFHSGTQTDSIHLAYQCKGETCVMFANYNINGFNAMRDCGRKIAFQHKNTAVVLYRPVNSAEREVSFAGLNVFFNKYGKAIKRVKIGDVIKTDFSEITVDGLQPVFIDAREHFIFLHPLINFSENVCIKVGIFEDYYVISFVNISEEGAKLHKKEICMQTNGFVCEVRAAYEGYTFESFVEEFSDFKISDGLICNVHTRYAFMREVHYSHHDCELEACISPLSDGIRYITVNGGILHRERLGICEYNDYKQQEQ